MIGEEVLKEVSRRITSRRGTRSVADSVLATALGVTQAALGQWRQRELTPRQVVNLMERAEKRAVSETLANAVQPIVEFFLIKPAVSRQGARWELFSIEDGNSAAHPYLSGLKEHLDSEHGIYIFHDSRGRAIYAGKAQRQSLWREMNSAFNRDRGEVQSIKRVGHPQLRVEYRIFQERRRRIKRNIVPIYELASYFSAYRVADGLIGRFEALILRAFANDLLNARMENF